MSTRYSLPEHLSAEDHDRVARARTGAALVLAAGAFVFVAFVGAALLPLGEPTVAAAPEVPAVASLPGA